MSTDPRRQAFLERHPDVSPEELDALLEQRRSSRRWIIGLSVALAITLVTTLALGLRINHVVRHDTKTITAEIAAEQISEIERVLGARAEGGRQLAVRVFEFALGLAQDNAVLRKTRGRWDDLASRTTDLRDRLDELPRKPISTTRKMAKAVPDLIDALTTFIVEFLAQLDRLKPQVAASLDGTARALTAEEFDVKRLLDAFEITLDPLVGDHEVQRMTWQNLRAEIVAWQAGFEADVDELRSKVNDDALRREFMARFVDAFLGL